jgi:hypothetical protein
MVGCQLSWFMTLNLYGGAHESGNRWKHKGRRGFLTGSDLPENNNPTSCVLVYYDLLVLIYPYSSFYMPRRVGIQGRSKSVIIILGLDSMSTCLFYKIYQLYSSGYGPRDLDPLDEWVNSWWAPLSCSPSPVSRVTMVPNLITMNSGYIVPSYQTSCLAAARRRTPRTPVALHRSIIPSHLSALLCPSRCLTFASVQHRATSKVHTPDVRLCRRLVTIASPLLQSANA